jgi:predicted RNA methylase
MENISELDILIKTHIGLERQGPGSEEMTLKALGFIENAENISQAADLGCGTGGQTMTLARRIPGQITGVDIFPEFIGVWQYYGYVFFIGKKL